jgi:hypothetical protein
MRPAQHRPGTLTEVEPIPAEVVGRLADSVIDRYEQLTRDGRPAGQALWPPVEDRVAAERAARTVAVEFEKTAPSREWSVPGARVQQLAADAIGLYVEGVVYDYDREQARAAAVRECLEGEAARAELPPPERHAAAVAEPAPPDVPGFTKLVERAERARGRGER